MEFWMSGEVQEEVDDAFARLCGTIEKAVAKRIGPHNYGMGLTSWDVIAIILSEDGPDFREIKKYNRKKRDCDIRLKVDFNAFRVGDDQQRAALLCEMLLRSLDVLEEFRIADFNLTQMREDFCELASAKGWL